MNNRTQHRSWIFGAMTFGALTLVALSALLFIAARPAQAQTETVLWNFNGGDGAVPQSGLTSHEGNFYGTTYFGGIFGNGAVFELSPNGSGGWNETVLYSFTGGADGQYPDLSYVIFDGLGNLYTTASYGGTHGDGVAFELSPVGTSWTETVLYNFAGGTDGATPLGGLIVDPVGNLYGTTYGNGGTVFELSPSVGGWTEQVIYSLDDVAGLTMDAAGNIFGASVSTVFDLSPNGKGGWTPTVLHTFTGSPKDGSNAYGTPVLDKAGNVYGTTFYGGAKNNGTVYKLSLGKKGKWTEKILYSCKGGKKDGANPYAGIVLDAAGNIYGTTLAGGGSNDGTVYELVAPVGKGSYKEKVLWSFNGTDGAYPYDSLILDSAANLYGTTSRGGSSNAGVVFELNLSAPATTTTLSSMPNPSTYGEAVTFTAVVAPAPPDGETVSFVNGKVAMGTGTLSGGTVSFTTSTLKVGTRSITAVYGGDSEFSGSTSNIVKQVVNKAAE